MGGGEEARGHGRYELHSSNFKLLLESHEVLRVCLRVVVRDEYLRVAHAVDGRVVELMALAHLSMTWTWELGGWSETALHCYAHA